MLIPKCLPRSGRKGADKLRVLERRYNHLEAKKYKNSFDHAEISAIKWIIARVLADERVISEEVFHAVTQST